MKNLHIHFIFFKKNIKLWPTAARRARHVRKLKLRLYINTQRSENNLINNIKKKYGDNLVLIIGNGNVNPSMKYIISTPNKGLKKLLSKHYDQHKILIFKN